MKKTQNSFFISIPEIIRKRILILLRIENSRRIYVLSIIGFSFFFLFLILDYIRYTDGKIQLWNLYFYLFLNHLAFVLFVFPIITIRVKHKAFAIGRFKYITFFIYTWTLFLGVMIITMAILSLIDRGSLTMYALYIIIANLALIMRHQDRVLLNLTSFLVISFSIIPLYQDNFEALFIHLLEAIGITITSFVVSTVIFNAYVRQVYTDKMLEIKTAEIEKEKNRSNTLLNNILPEEIAKELKEKGTVKPRHFSSATIMLIDFKNFSTISKSLTTERLIAVLDFCFKKFDHISSKYNLEKIKTMGDAYLCVGGVPESNATHPFDAIGAAREILTFLEEWKTTQIANNEPYFEGRIGIHTGPVIAGVVGEKKFVFDIWGDAVNITARVETSGESGKINISQTTYNLIKQKYKCIPRGEISTKNQEPLKMYFVEV